MNKTELNVMLIRRGISKKELASRIGINESTLYRKLSGIVEFTLREIKTITKYLNLTEDEVFLIFFSDELANTQEI